MRASLGAHAGVCAVRPEARERVPVLRALLRDTRDEANRESCPLSPWAQFPGSRGTEPEFAFGRVEFGSVESEFPRILSGAGPLGFGRGTLCPSGLSLRE